jgi:hypothetical protein
VLLILVVADFVWSASGFLPLIVSSLAGKLIGVEQMHGSLPTTSKNLSVLGGVYAAGYLLSLGLVLAGIGRLRTNAKSRSAAVVIIGVASLWIVGVVLGIYACYLTVINKDYLFSPSISEALLIPWVAWFGVLFYYWHARPEAFLRKYLKAMLLGSWVEFIVALAITISVRQREGCFCAIGSWLTLVFIVPVIVWLIGPALYLFYLNEKREQSPRALKLILLRKSKVHNVSPITHSTADGPTVS